MTPSLASHTPRHMRDHPEADSRVATISVSRPGGATLCIGLAMTGVEGDASRRLSRRMQESSACMRWR